MVGSLVYMILVFMAPYASALCRSYGHRSVIMIGGTVASAAIIGSSFTTKITQLYYTYGMLTGKLAMIHYWQLLSCRIFKFAFSWRTFEQ